MKVAVVTPIYKELFTEGERFSLQHGFKTLSAFDRIFVAPKGLRYRDCVIADRVVSFDPRYFRNIAGYNRLMLSEEFYRSFLDYDYILIYQPDAFVFRDELLSWCAKGYVYIGAPWPGGINMHPYGFPGLNYIAEYFPFAVRTRKIFVGNGGFSLRNIRAFLDILEENRFVARTWAGNEDAYWPYYAAIQDGVSPLPDEIEASKFSLELGAEGYYRANNQLLPFGCHGWEKYSVDFWRKIMAEQFPEYRTIAPLLG